MKLQFKTDRRVGHRYRINTALPILVPEEGLVTQAALRRGLGVRSVECCELHGVKVAPRGQRTRAHETHGPCSLVPEEGLEPTRGVNLTGS